jgi:hypothetical protein
LDPLKIPLDLAQHKNKGQDYHEIQGRDQIIERPPVVLEPPPYHNPDVRDEERKKHDDIIDRGSPVHHIFFSVCFIIGKEQDQVHENQEKGKVDQVGQFQGYGGQLSLPVKPERFQYYDRNDVYEQKSGDENKMQQELEKIIHLPFSWFQLK